MTAGGAGAPNVQKGGDEHPQYFGLANKSHAFDVTTVETIASLNVFSLNFL